MPRVDDLGLVIATWLAVMWEGVEGATILAAVLLAQWVVAAAGPWLEGRGSS